MTGLPGGMPEISPQLSAAILIGLLVVGALLAVIDVVLIAVWVTDGSREKPLLARCWSLAHVFLGLQAWLALTLLIGTPIMLVLFLSLPHDSVQATRSIAWASLPLLILQNLAMAAVVALFVRQVYREPLSSVGFSRRGLGRYLALGALAAVLAIPVSDLIERLSALLVVRALPHRWDRLL